MTAAAPDRMGRAPRPLCHMLGAQLPAIQRAPAGIAPPPVATDPAMRSPDPGPVAMNHDPSPAPQARPRPRTARPTLDRPVFET